MSEVEGGILVFNSLRFSSSSLPSPRFSSLLLVLCFFSSPRSLLPRSLLLARSLLFFSFRSTSPNRIQENCYTSVEIFPWPGVMHVWYCIVSTPASLPDEVVERIHRPHENPNFAPAACMHYILVCYGLESFSFFTMIVTINCSVSDMHILAVRTSMQFVFFHEFSPIAQTRCETEQFIRTIIAIVLCSRAHPLACWLSPLAGILHTYSSSQRIHINSEMIQACRHICTFSSNWGFIASSGHITELSHLLRGRYISAS